MEKTRILISGLGGIAQIAHLPILSKMSNVEIAGVCDIDRSKTRSIAEKYNVKSSFTSIDEMLDKTEADCLVVTSPTSLHHEQAIKGLQKGLNVLAEKPLARNFQEAASIVDAAKKAKKLLMVGMNNRFLPEVMMQESFVSAGEIGDVFYIKAGYLKKRSTAEKWSVNKSESGGGVFMDLGIVILDIALWMMKFPRIKSVSAVNFNHSFKDVEDSSFVLLRFENGSIVSIETSWTLHRASDMFYCNVYGKEGSTSINPLRIYKNMHDTLVNVTPVKIEKPANLFKRTYEYELNNFVNSVLTGKRSLSDGSEALDRMKIVDAIYESAKAGKEISFK
ncbi:MAG TPA: Gfo/Idh/MocA family oxidoreductase [Ignavibacteria bacterium]|nr:Gfo/Idh/MocA family oxidoreductase [Ignavibacteria bacterium]HMQ98074.1 Gfo/Idh/MocA family oxidoreductase [Ignavibacteria bacterium]